MKKLEKLLLTELNVVSYVPGNEENISDEAINMALTVNENMASLGYTFNTKDILALSVSASLYDIFDRISEMLPTVKAKPMYPDFPRQVMAISEAEFRFHQLVHYFSTYGIEFLTGKSVSRGWLPTVQDTEKTCKDERILSLSVIELIPEEEIFEYAISKILGKRERMTIPELEIVELAVDKVSAEFLSGLKVTFKENIEGVFDVAASREREIALPIMKSICQHSGDALKNIDTVLKKHEYHLKTSEKKTFVKLLELYSAYDFKNNLMVSRKRREDNLKVLRYLDYNKYSRSIQHKNIVKALRNGDIKSWESVAKKKLIEKQGDALAFVAQRPGIMLRMLSWIMSLGYDSEEIYYYLSRNSKGISTQLLISVYNAFATIVQNDEKEIAEVRNSGTTEEKIRKEYERRKSYIRSDLQRYYHSEYERFNGYVRRQLEACSPSRVLSKRDAALKKLKEKYKGMVDASVRPEMKELLALKRERKQLKLEMARLKRGNERKAAKNTAGNVEYKNVCKKSRVPGKLKMINPHRMFELRNQIKNLNEKISMLEAKVNEMKSAKRDGLSYELLAEKNNLMWAYAEKLEKAMAATRSWNEKLSEYRNLYLKSLSELDHEVELRERDTLLWMQRELKIHAEDELKKERKIKALQERAQKHLEGIDEKRQLVRRVLEDKYRNQELKITGKKVFVDMQEYDLEHSTLDFGDKSAEGGYIPSGIAYKIPEEANFVRFFVYWNDEMRVDLDLHAYFETQSGDWENVGWYSNFRKNGVVHSGDITHSDAAEYIDIDMNNCVSRVKAIINLFSGPLGFADIDDCYVGMMAVKENGENVELYNRANCFFTHEIKQRVKTLEYGYIDVKNRYVKFVGQKCNMTDFYNGDGNYELLERGMRLSEYLEILFKTQNVTVVSSREEADIILTMGKPDCDNGISLIDENFFM